MNIITHSISLKIAGYSKLACSVMGIYGLFLLVIIISLSHVFFYRFQDNPLFFIAVAAALFLIILLFLTWSVLPFSSKEQYENCLNITDLSGFMMAGFSLLITLFFYSNKLHIESWYYLAIPIILAASIWYYIWGLRASVIFLFFAGLLFYIALIWIAPMDVKAANMLPLVEAAAHDLLSGKNPYYQYYREVYEGPFTYLPGLLLPYTFLVALGIDLRVLNIIGLLIIVFIFESSFKSRASTGILSFTIYPILLSPPVAQMIINGHIWPYWVFLLLTVSFLYQNKLFMASFFFGLTLATRQPSLFLIGPFFLYLYSQVRLLDLIKYGTLSIVVYAVMVAPFALTAEQGSWVQWYTSYLSWGVGLPQVAAGSLSYWLNLEGIYKYAQICILILCMLVIWRVLKITKYKFESSLYVTGIGYVWFIFFNSYVTRYLYFPGFFLMAFALTIGLSRLERYDTATLDHTKTDRES